MSQADNSGGYQGQSYTPQPYGGGGVQMPPGYGQVAYPGGFQPPRFGTKTFFVAGLLTLIPFVGIGMAAIYYFTKQQPAAFDGGRAAGSAIVAVLAGIVIWFLIYIVFFVLLFGLMR